MKKYKWHIGIVAITVVLIAGFSVRAQSSDDLYNEILSLLKGLKTEEEFVLGGTQRQRSTVCQGAGVATTVPEFITTTSASSTCEFFVENMSAVDLNFTISGSSTSAILQTEIYFSPDSSDGTISNGTWYPLLTKIVADGRITFSSDPAIFDLTASDAFVTTTHQFFVEDINARWMQTRTAVRGANGSFHLELSGRRNVN